MRSDVAGLEPRPLRTDVSVLYVDPRGVYPTLVADWWDEARDARNYSGPNPVVAHPPCGPWGSLAHLYKGDEKGHALHAIAQVRQFGGCLEHPVQSRLWAECAVPAPGELPDAYGGVTVDLEQVSWGHACRKPTRLYLVGIRNLPGYRRGGEPTHQIFGSRRADNALKHGHRTDLKAASSEIRRRTPVAFAEWLLDLAAQARRT